MNKILTDEMLNYLGDKYQIYRKCMSGVDHHEQILTFDQYIQSQIRLMELSLLKLRKDKVLGRG